MRPVGDVDSHQACVCVCVCVCVSVCVCVDYSPDT